MIQKILKRVCVSVCVRIKGQESKATGIAGSNESPEINDRHI